MAVTFDGAPRVPPSAHTPAYGEVDLTTCDREPIHIPGAIQPHGVLLSLDADLVVVTVSANVATMLGVPAADALGLSLADLLGDDVAALVQRGAPDTSGADLFVALLPETERTAGGDLVGHLVEVRSHRSGPRLVVEVEETDFSAQNQLSLRGSRRAMGRLAACTDVVSLGQQLTTEIRDLLGFDRVMLYRFDEMWNGEVIAEDKREDLNPFLGLHYPATDIPAQARRLYTVNWTRLIVDIDYTPVPLEPLVDPGTRAPLDLSHSSLRSVSPIHVEYLGHMGVTASMSISIVIDGQLWGLVACHHYSGPHRPSQDARAAAELLGQVTSQMFFDREQAEKREKTFLTKARLAELTARVSTSTEDPMRALVDDPDLAPLLDAQGVALCYDGEITTAGPVPDEPTLRRIARLLEVTDSYVTQTDHLSALDPDLASVARTAAGALRAGSAPDRWLLWLRAEQEHFVDWGGDPTNKLLAAQEGPHVRLSPRRSFEKWRQVVRGRSQPWETHQLEAADALGAHMTSVLLLHSREQIAMAESMQRSVVLDRAPELEGLELSALYLPASTYQLGGDWWDAFDLGRGRTAIVVGDVAGHGVLAASAMVQIRSALRAYLFEGHDPATCLDRLDGFMDQLLPDQLASGVVAIYDRTTHRLEVASAGHPPPLLQDSDGVRFLAVDPRPLLGVGARPAETTVVDLEVGATVLLFTDGLVERRDTDIDACLDRLTRPDVAVGDRALDEWTQQLIVDLDVTQDDDTTLLAFRRV